MPDLSRDSFAPGVNLTIEDDCSPDAASDVCVKNKAEPSAGTEESFGQPGTIGIVSHRHRKP
jgi:hypothetical protein